ncbi:MAG: DUF882 domain-containing protein [Desulfobulbaceae bacterium]|uniref:Murein endopeptidase K n=1 Tax=Candidatus Desulfatifera sulfidica TaxID=2841691 RepID=A0A8J6NAN0_9BACT|nr:DUF882 domain-containing protein [Candidatus Desulfatifera sulfidica]
MKESVEEVSRLSRRSFLLASAQLAGALWVVAPVESLAVPILKAEAEKKKRDRRLLTIKAESRVRKKAITLHNLNTGEHLELFARSGRERNDECQGQVQKFLRDHRTGEQHAIDPDLIDILADIQYACDRRGVFEILSGYRSPKTNTMLRKRSNNVARKSYHMTGQAIDIRFQGLSTRELRNVARSLKRGGVGYYPKSSFVHIDTGPVRTW